MRRWIGRAGLVGLGVGVALGLAEVAMRLASPELPSLAPLASLDPLARGEAQQWLEPPDRYSPDCRRLVAGRGALAGRRARRVAGDGVADDAPARARLWVVGDSVVQGFGVPQDQAWPHLLAARQSSALGAAVKLSTVGANGLGACGWMHALHQELDESRAPDAVVLQLFGDDLERRDVVLVDGQPVASPAAAPGWLRPLASHSWLGNRLWLAWHARWRAQTPRRDIDRAALLGPLQGALRRLDEADVPWVLALVPPAGIERCDAAAAALSDCGWIGTDLDRMARWLTETRVPFLDLRELWAAHPTDTLPEEERDWRERGRLPVHPGPDGHAVLAGAVWPALAAALP